MSSRKSEGPTGVVLGDPEKIKRLPEGILRLAQKEYENQYGHSQDYERIQERGGLSYGEVVYLLADLAERHGATPTAPRGAK